MAAITLSDASSRYSALRTDAVATTTDWIVVPRKARQAIFHLDISVAGTSTVPVIKGAFLGTKDDARVITLLTGSTITAVGYHTYTIGGGVTAVADSATVSTAAAANVALPALIGITTTRTGSTYSTAVEFRE